MQSLALVVLLVSCACHASGGIIADSAKDGVDAMRNAALTTLDAAETVALYPGQKIIQGIGVSNAFFMNAIAACQNRIDDAAVSFRRHADLMRDVATDNIVWMQANRAALDQCVNAVCTFLAANTAPEAAQQAVRSASDVIGTGIDNVVDARAAGRQSTYERYVRCINAAHVSAYLALYVPLAATSVSHALAVDAVHVGLATTHHGFNAGRAVVNKVADGAKSAIDMALGTERPQQLARDHPHQD